jgi:signal recognition particle receptor subunit beta
VPGQIHYAASRRLILRGTDGVVLVVDSQRERLEANCESRQGLLDDLQAHDLDAATLPRLVQYNKRDTPTALDLQELRRELNPDGCPELPAVAHQGFGVRDTLREISRHVLRSIRQKLDRGG